MNMEAPLKNRVAVVTGAGQGTGGIGREIARQLAMNGASVMVADLDPKVTETESQLRLQGARDVACFSGDLSDEETVRRLVEQTIERWGRIDILVNNAGGGIIRPFLEHTPQTLQETVDRNLWTAIWCSYFSLPHMVERNYGRIINIGADSVRNGLWDHAGYNAAKGGVHGMTTGLAREFAPYDITVNTVSPCVVETERLLTRMKDSPELASKVVGIVPKGRAVRPEEIASLVTYLAGEPARFITGQVVSVNGGATML